MRPAPPLALSPPLALVLALLLCWTTATSAAGDLQQFRDWEALCRQDGSGLCVMESEAKEESDVKARLRLARPTQGPIASLTLLLAGEDATLAGPVTLTVDDRKPHGLKEPAPIAGGLNVEDPGLMKSLTPELRSGRSLTIGFRDAAGAARKAVFSLLGVTAALRHFDRSQKRPAPDLLPPPASGEAAAATSAETFTPAGSLPPIGGCYDHERKVDKSGRFLGWLSRNRC